MIHTKNFYLNESTQYAQGMENLSDLGYSLSIPWNDISTAGWINNPGQTMKVWGTENKLITRSDPEYFAPGDLIRSNVIPSININDPVYKFDRSDFTYTVW